MPQFTSQLSRRRLALGGGGAAALLAVAVIVVAVWYFVLRGDAPPPVALEQAVAVAATSEAEAEADADAAPAAQAADVETEAEAEEPAVAARDDGEAGEEDSPKAAAAAAPEPDAAEEAAAAAAKEEALAPDPGLVGSWQVVADGSSFAGYRVEEELARIGAVTAVGRSTVLSGSLVFDGAAITEVVIEVDLTALTSDDSRRDGALRRQALETNTYPTTTFTLTEPIPIDAVPAEGVALSVTATGDLTLHGVTREVRIPMEGQLVGDRVAVVGSLEIVFADYDMDTPSAFIVLAIDDHGIMEFQLVFERS